MATSIAHFSRRGVVLHPQVLSEHFRIFGLLYDTAEAAAREAFKALLQELLELYVSHLLGRGKRVPASRIDHTSISWRCGRCGSQARRHFVRNGHYQRALGTHWGHVRGISVPMLRCQRCGGYVSGSFPFLGKYQRLWDDLWQQALLDCSLGLSLRQQIARQEAEGLWPVSLQALNRRINCGAQRLLILREVQLAEVPPVVQFDGIYFPIVERTRQMKRDRCHRLRRRLRSRSRVALVALGLWPDGRHQVIGWTLADSESEEAWRDFLLALRARGLTPEAGFRLAIGDGVSALKQAVDFVYYGQMPFQLCHFHKIQRIVHRNYLRDRAHRGDLLRDAGHVLAGSSLTRSTAASRTSARNGKSRSPRACAASCATSAGA